LRRSQTLRSLLYVLIALLTIAAGILLRYFFRRKRPVEMVAATAQAVAVEELNQGQLAADKLPEDRWMALAQEWILRGDLRMAVRALYLGSLSYLAGHSLIGIRASKTNRDYEAELRRRVRDRTDVALFFSQNARAFERVWYGDHEVSAEIIENFKANLKRMKACAEG